MAICFLQSCFILFYPGLESDGTSRSVSFPKHQKPAVIKIYQDEWKHTPAGFTRHLLRLSSLP